MLYDWANSAYATTVMAGFFPVFFKEYWSRGLSPFESTYFLGLANSSAGLLIALLAPLLGALADQGYGKKVFLALFTFTGALTTANLFFVPMGGWSQAAWLYALSNFAFGGALIFYDALLVDVSPREKMDRISSWGYSMGYLGGGLLFTLNVLMYLKPAWFGLSSGPLGIRISFITVGLWWILFSLPLFFIVRERYRPPVRPKFIPTLQKSFGQLYLFARQVSLHRPLLLFLGAYFIYIDGLNTIITMSVDYGMALGFQPADLISALLIVQFIGFPSALGTMKLAERLGSKRTVLICLMVYGVITLLASMMTEVWHFYAMAAGIGLVQGGVQALSRSIYARMIPPEEAGEYFGFFNLLTKFSAVLGPFLVGSVSLLTKEPRWSILVILIMFILGAWMLTRVNTEYRVRR